MMTVVEDVGWRREEGDLGEANGKTA